MYGLSKSLRKCHYYLKTPDKISALYIVIALALDIVTTPSKLMTKILLTI